MSNLIITISIVFFFVLFTFLIFIFIVVAIAELKKKNLHKNFMPKISILIPSYNEEKNIESCLNSVLKSYYPKKKLEIIVIDDGSTDKTLQMLNKFKEKIKILTQKHLGKTEALNLGTNNSKHKYILTIDADTILEKNAIREIIKPLVDQTVGATNGAIKVKNKKGWIQSFQNIEYHYNNLIRNSFSSVFKSGIWFFGSFACYNREVLKKIGFFKKDTITEDMDIAMEIKKANYKTINVPTASAFTVVPNNLKDLYIQRSRWWIGGLQTLSKNKDMFSTKYGPSILFLFINQFFWSFYAWLSLPLIIYQINYWLPYNSDTFLNLFSYLFRWFSFLGPIYVIYKIPEWGISFFTIFGVLSGIISVLMILHAIKKYNDTLNLRNLVAIFFYFPYTIILNTIIIFSIIRIKLLKRRFFIK